MENKIEITDPAVSAHQDDTGEDVYIFPATPAQNRFWLLDQLSPGDPALNIPLAASLSGQLERIWLERSINELITRHEALRTTFRTFEGEVVQVIHPRQTAALEWQDISDLPEPEQGARVRELLTKEAGKGLVISQGPVFRAGIIQLQKDRYVLYLTAHHIVCDGWSSGIILRELAEIYTAQAGGAPGLPELPLQYADFSQWQLEWLKSPGAEESRKFWMGLLHGIPPVLNLPTDHPRKPGRLQPSEIRSLLLPVSLTESLKNLSTREELTPFMLFFAAYATVLYRYTGSLDFIVGTPAANRKQTSLEGVVGLFSNPLALRMDFSGNPTLRTLLSRVKELALGAFDHQSYPFEKLLESIPANPARMGLPWLQTYFIFQKAFLQPQNMPGLSLEPLRSVSPGAMFEWSLAVLERTEGVRLQLEYNTNLFDRTTIDRVLDQLRYVLELMLTDLNVKVDHLQILTPPERQQQLAAWNATRREIAPKEPIHELFEKQAAAAPEAPAIRRRNSPISYQELNRRATSLAGDLRRLGVKEKEKVGLLAEKSLEYCLGFLAILKAGGCCVILDPSLTETELSNRIQSSGVAALMGMSDMSPALRPAGIQTIFLDTAGNNPAAAPPENVVSQPLPEDPACVRFTCGRLVGAKAARITHRALVNAAMAARHEFGIQSTDVLAFSSEEMLPALLAGAELVLPDCQADLSLEKWLEWIRSAGITVAALPTGCWLEMLRTHPGNAKLDSGRLRLLALGGSPIPPAALRSWRRLAPASIQLIDRYMLAETSGAIAFSEPLSIGDKISPVSIARPALNSQIYLLDKNLEPVAVGAPGDIFIGGESVASGYLAPAATGAVDFIKNPFGDRTNDRLLNTGDRGRFLAQQGIELIGRSEDLARTNGFKLEFYEIRQVLSDHLQVWDVILEPSAGGDTAVVAHVLIVPGGTVDNSGLTHFLRERLPAYMIPQEIRIWTKFPRNPNGLVDLKALAHGSVNGKARELRGPQPKKKEKPLAHAPSAPAGESLGECGRTSDQNGFHATEPAREYFGSPSPGTPMEQALARIWCDVLGLRQVGLHDNFFEIGGHSLVAMRLVNEINRTLKQNLHR